MSGNAPLAGFRPGKRLLRSLRNRGVDVAAIPLSPAERFLAPIRTGVPRPVPGAAPAAAAKERTPLLPSSTSPWRRDAAAPAAAFQHAHMPPEAEAAATCSSMAVGILYELATGGSDGEDADVHEPNGEASDPKAADRLDGCRVTASTLLCVSLLIGPATAGGHALGAPVVASELAPPPWSYRIWVPAMMLVAGLAALQAAPQHRSSRPLRAAGWHASAAVGALSLWGGVGALLADTVAPGPPATHDAKLYRALLQGYMAAGSVLVALLLVRAVAKANRASAAERWAEARWRWRRNERRRLMRPKTVEDLEKRPASSLRKSFTPKQPPGAQGDDDDEEEENDSGELRSVALLGPRGRPVLSLLLGPLSLICGWLSALMVVNVATFVAAVEAALGLAAGAEHGILAALLIATVGGLAALGCHRRGGDGWLAAGCAWGFGSIAYAPRANFQRGLRLRGRDAVTFSAAVVAGSVLVAWLAAVAQQGAETIIKEAEREEEEEQLRAVGDEHVVGQPSGQPGSGRKGEQPWQTALEALMPLSPPKHSGGASGRGDADRPRRASGMAPTPLGAPEAPANRFELTTELIRM